MFDRVFGVSEQGVLRTEKRTGTAPHVIRGKPSTLIRQSCGESGLLKVDKENAR